MPAGARGRAATPIAKDAASSGLTEGQRAFLGSLEAEERSRFDALPAAMRAKHLEMLRFGGDAVIRAHVLATLRPPRPGGRICTPEDDIPTLLSALAEGRSPNAALSLAGRLVREWRDPGSFRFYVAKAEEVRSGRRAIETLGEAYRQASNPKSRKPGAVFAHALKALDHRRSSGRYITPS